ncbi:MAG: hypothetical protein ACXWQ5_00345 [Ktedonobacterales bacterium]
MGFLLPDDYPNEEEWERIRKRFHCWHEWPEGADKTEVGCTKCGYVALKEIDPHSPEGLAVLRQFLQSKPEDYVHLVAPVMLDDDDEES